MDTWIQSLLDLLRPLRPTLDAAAQTVTQTAGAAGAAVGSASAHLDLPSLLALAGLLGWASGFRLYAVVFLVGLAGALGWLPLPTGLHVLQHPAMLTASGFMLFVEFFADKIPVLDSLWDVVHSVVRIPAGAALAAGVFGADSTTMASVAALLGGALAATSQAAKTSTRAAINTSPEPFSNIAASLVEDGLVLGGAWLASTHPLAFGIALAIGVVLMLWLVATLFQFLRGALRRLRGFVQPSPTPS